MLDENILMMSATDAIEADDKERLVRTAIKAFHTNPEQYEQIRKFASERGFYLIIKSKADFHEPHAFNFGLVITDERETIYFGCMRGWDFPDTIEDWWGEGSTRSMMKAYLFGLFSDLVKGKDSSGQDINAPLFARRMAQDSMRRLKDEFPKILTQADQKRIENALSIDLS